VKKIVVLLAVAIATFVAAVALCQEAAVVTPKDIAEGVGSVVDATKTGSWIAISASVVALLGNLFRLPALGGITKKIPKRWRIVVPIVLGACAGLLGGVVGGMTWTEAIIAAVFTGPSAVFAHEAFVESLLGKRHKKEAAASGDGA